MNNKIRIALRVTPQLDYRLKKLAEKKEISKNSLVAMLIKEGMDRMEQNTKP